MRRYDLSPERNHAHTNANALANAWRFTNTNSNTSCRAVSLIDNDRKIALIYRDGTQDPLA
jgi:hypothetical protein